MTSACRDVIHCPHCGELIAAEGAFSTWLRTQPELDSQKGYVAMDHDLMWHRYRTHPEGRRFQLMMNIEVKSFGTEPTECQLDSMCMENQVLRNRRQTPTKKLRWQAGHAPLQVWSSMHKQKIWLRHFGWHLLRFSHRGPEDSEWIEWDRKRIDIETLVALLKFDLDPDNLQPMELRSHHRKREKPKWLRPKLFDDHPFIDLPAP